jgi:predicted transcriptional regulator
MNKKNNLIEVDLSGVLPKRMNVEEADALADYIASYKSLQKTINVYQAVVRFLKNGKLTVEEIADCLSLPKSWIQLIQKELRMTVHPSFDTPPFA